MWIGSKENETSQPLGISWPKIPLLVLGVHISYGQDACNKLNFEDRIQSANK